MTGFDHEKVNHNVGEYVRDMAQTNGVESFWSMLKRAHKGTFHKISPKHLDRYVHEFAGKHNVRDSGTLAQMRDTVARLVGRTLLYRDLIADNGLSSGGADLVDGTEHAPTSRVWRLSNPAPGAAQAILSLRRSSSGS